MKLLLLHFSNVPTNFGILWFYFLTVENIFNFLFLLQQLEAIWLIYKYLVIFLDTCYYQ
jgi:hypothetical protein